MLSAFWNICKSGEISNFTSHLSALPSLWPLRVSTLLLSSLGPCSPLQWQFVTFATKQNPWGTSQKHWERILIPTDCDSIGQRWGPHIDIFVKAPWDVLNCTQVESLMWATFISSLALTRNQTCQAYYNFDTFAVGLRLTQKGIILWGGGCSPSHELLPHLFFFQICWLLLGCFTNPMLLPLWKPHM